MQLGAASVTRQVEWVGVVGAASALFPETPGSAWTELERWLAPAFWEPASDGYRAAIQTWVVGVDDLTVLVDTGVGDGRDRPQVRQFAHLSTGFDQALERAGIRPEQVDLVVNTHIHYDHVGWNTRWDGSSWVPTFPNARYLVPEADYRYFDPDNRASMRAPKDDDERRRLEGIALVFDDSIRPVAEAGQIELWSGHHEVSASLHLDAAAGHTPGSSVLWLDSGPGAVFVGDLLHTPVQLERPQDPCAFDLDKARAAASRRRVLRQATDRGAAVLPAHFAGHGGATLSSTDQGSHVMDWLPFSAL